GSNATGVVDLHPDAIKETVKFMDENFEDANVGLIYSAGEKNSVTQIEAVQDAMEGTSLSAEEDRKSTRLNSSHVSISYAVFCLCRRRRVHNSFPTRRSSDLRKQCNRCSRFTS